MTPNDEAAAAALPEAVQQALDKGTKVFEVEFDLGDTHYVTYCKTPKVADISRFSKTAKKDDIAAAQNLVVGGLIHPPFAELKGMFEELPGVMIGLAAKLMELCGADTEFSAKKL